MVNRENLQEAWAKARTLKAAADLAVVDPDRSLLIDALQTIHAVSPFGEFNAERHTARREIHAFLSGEADPDFYRIHGRTVIQRGFLLDKLTEAAVQFAEGSPLYPEQDDLVVAMQRRIQHADREYRQWLGNPVGVLPAPKPAFHL